MDFPPAPRLFTSHLQLSPAIAQNLREKPKNNPQRQLISPENPTMFTTLQFFPSSLRRGVAQSGSASGLGPEGRRFESCLPDQFSVTAKAAFSKILVFVNS